MRHERPHKAEAVDGRAKRAPQQSHSRIVGDESVRQFHDQGSEGGFQSGGVLVYWYCSAVTSQRLMAMREGMNRG